MTASEQLYPTAPPITLVERDEMYQYFKKNNHEQQLLSRIEGIKSDLKRYTRLKRKWNNAQTILKIGSTTAFLGIEGATAVISLVTTAGVTIPILIGVGGALELLLSQGINTIFEIKKKKYIERINLCNKTIDRVYTLSKKAMADKIIDDNEMAEFKSILDSYEKTYQKEVELNSSIKEMKSAS